MFLKQQNRKAFTMVELVFVIVIIGILAAIAVPKMAATRDDAVITKAIATIASARSALSTTRQKNILKGVFLDINASSVGDNFSELLEYAVKSCSASKCNGWSTSDSAYTFHGPTGDVTFTLQSNKLNCTSGLCSLYE